MKNMSCDKKKKTFAVPVLSSTVNKEILQENLVFEHYSRYTCSSKDIPVDITSRLMLHGNRCIVERSRALFMYAGTNRVSIFK
jgi:hypothetical protein